MHFTTFTRHTKGTTSQHALQTLCSNVSCNCLHCLQLLTQSPNGFDKTGPYRAKFILEALGDLRDRLRAAGSDLLVRIGKPGAYLVAGSWC